MFYFQQLLNTALAGIDGTAIISTVTNIAFAILLIGFLIGLYQAAFRGGDLQALAGTAIKYLVVAMIVSNWATVFRGVNGSFNTIANSIGSSSGAGDMFQSWMGQLQQQFANNPSLTLTDIITGDAASTITVVLLVVAYLLYALAMIVFCFFYTLFGAILYVVGPLVLALIPIPGVGQLGKSYAVNVMIWNAWGILYAVFGALITAIQVNQVNNILGNGFAMSAAKEIAIVTRSEEHSLNASEEVGSSGSADGNVTSTEATNVSPAVRRRLPDERHSLTHHFSVGGQEGYVTVGLYEDGLPGELFIRIAKEGSTVSGLMDSFATAVSLALQYGVPLRVLCDKFSHTRFEPSGWSGNPKIGYAKSLADYLFRWLELRFLKGEQGLLFELPRPALPQREVSSVVEGLGQVVELGDAPPCQFCGSLMVRNGSCYRCMTCGSTSGCS